jgi:hypothetical protein
MLNSRKKFFLLLAGFLSPLTIYAAPISLLDFTSAGDVFVAADGNDATLTFDTNSFGQAELTNNGVPNVIIATNGTSLEFSYDYIVSAFSSTVFEARLFDTAGGIFGGTLDTLFVERFTFPQSGAVSWDLSGYTGLTLGLDFRLNNMDPGLQFGGTITTISNLAIVDNLPSPVPVPAAVWLFGTALIGLVGYSKRRKAV